MNHTSGRTDQQRAAAAVYSDRDALGAILTHTLIVFLNGIYDQIKNVAVTTQSEQRLCRQPGESVLAHCMDWPGQILS